MIDLHHVELRFATAAEAADYAHAARESFREAYDTGDDPENVEIHLSRAFGEPIQRRELLDPQQRVLAAIEPGGAWAGFAMLRADSRAEGVTGHAPMEVVRFYTRATWYGRGLAARLMDGALAAARAADHDEVWLQVWEHNQRARRFYEKSGFVARGRNPFRFGDVWEEDIVYARVP